MRLAAAALLLALAAPVPAVDLAHVPAPPAGPPAASSSAVPSDESRCVADDVSGPVVTACEGERLHPLAAGDRLAGTRAVVTAEGARVRLVFPGWSLIVGPATRVTVGRPGTPVMLTYGSVRVDNRPGDPAGPELVVSSRLVNVHVRADGRALVTVTRGTRHVPDTMRVIALRGPATLAPHGARLASQLPENSQATGAGWIPVSRWAVKTLAADERADLERGSLMRAERAQLPGKAPLIPYESLKMDGAPLARDRTMYLSRADVPPEGRLEFTGQVRLDRVPPTLGEIYVAASIDGGKNWDRLKWIDGEGGFLYEIHPQDQLEYRLSFGVFQVQGGKLYETTDVYPVTYREAFLPALSDIKVCGNVLPADGSTLALYSDELVDYAVVLEGTVRCDAPLTRIRVEVSPDAGVRWRPATIVPAPAGEPTAGSFRVAFTPVPGAGYRFRVRTTYAQGTERIRPHQVLSDWDAAGPVRYTDQRSVERLAALVHELEGALRSGDQKRVKALLAPQFNLRGRDLARATGVHFRPGAAAREAGTLQVAVDWDRTEPGGAPLTGHAIFLFVKQADFQLVEVLGDDPLAAGPPGRHLPGEEGAAETQTVTLPLGTTLELSQHKLHPYDEQVIPEDLAYYREDDGSAVLGTHDRRLAALPDAKFQTYAGPEDRMRLEYRATVVPQEGAVLYLKTRQGAEAVLEVQEVSEGTKPRVKVAYRLLE